MKGVSLHARVVETSDERNEIYRLRYAVYVEEMQKPYPTAESGHGTLRDQLDDSATLIALVDGDNRIVGTVRCNYAADVAACEPLAGRLIIDRFERVLLPHITVCSRLVLAPSHRRRGTLSPLVRAIYRWGLQNDIHLNLIHTTLVLVPLFEHLGFRPFAERFIDADAGSEQQPLYLLLRDVAYLRAVNSPFVSELERLSPLDQHSPRPLYENALAAPGATRPTPRGWDSAGRMSVSVPLLRV